jgi:hypothetical protein
LDVRRLHGDKRKERLAQLAWLSENILRRFASLVALLLAAVLHVPPSTVSDGLCKLVRVGEG